jgi:hypothetical protein
MNLFDLGNFKNKLRLWQANSRKIKNNEAATIIQKFSKSKLEGVQAKRDMLNNATNKMINFYKLYAFNNMWKTSKDNYYRNLLVKLMQDIPDEEKHKYVKKYMVKWWDTQKENKEEAAANIINKKAKAFRSVKKRKDKENKKSTVEYMMKQLYLKNGDLLNCTLQLWRANAKQLKMEEAANILGSWIKPRYNKHKKDIANNGAQIMFDTLNNMYWRAPFEKMKLASKWIGLICKMREVYPKIYDAMRRKFVTPRLKLWHVNSVGHNAEETQKLTKWIEEKDQEIAKSLEMRRRNFIVKQFSKIERIEEIKKGLLLKFWNKTSKVIGFNEKAQLIAARVKGNSARASQLSFFIKSNDFRCFIPEFQQKSFFNFFNSFNFRELFNYEISSSHF